MLEPGDGKVVCEAVNASIEVLKLWMKWLRTGQFIASSSVHNIDWEVRKFEIGYWIDSRYSGNGYMTEAVQGITDFAFNHLNANRIEIRCDTKSEMIPERLSFDLECVIRNDDLSVDGSELRDTNIYALVK